MSSVPIRPTGTSSSRTLVRGLIARHVVGHGGEDQLLAFARQAWPREDEHAITKAAIGALGNDGTWDRLTADFLQDVRQRTVLGRMGFRRLPFHVRMLAASEGATGYWVGEGNPIPLSKPTIAGSRLAALQAAGIICLTRESLQNTSVLVEAALQEDLTAAVAGVIDQALLDPSNVGIADKMPASITYGAPSVASTGPFGEESMRTDLQALFNLYEGDPETAALAMSPRTALSICLMSARFGNTDMTTTGGTLFGLPVVTSNSLAGGSDGDTIALIDRRGIAYGLETFDIVQSTEADLLMSDDPPAGPAQMVSLFQTGTVAYKATAGANWENQREGGVVLLTGVDYSDVVS